MHKTMFEGINGSLSGKILGSVAVGIISAFALFVWSSSITLSSLDKGCRRSGGLKWRSGILGDILACISKHLKGAVTIITIPILSAFHGVLGFFGVSRLVKSSEFRHSSPPPHTDYPSLGESDLTEFISLVNESDDGPPWHFLMERSSSSLSYQAWYRDPPLGPMQCRTRTVFENVSPELLRDFFWDDEFRTRWDKMLVYFKTLYVCPRTGTMVVHWIRKLPILGNEKEYVIVRRIWESDSTYYCITKGTSYPTLPKTTVRRRVELYYSSWSIKQVKLRNGEGATASEVIFFHWEDMGIPRELVKMGARAGMWTVVKRMHSGLQAYKDLSQGRISSTSAYPVLARMTTKFELKPTTNTDRRSENEDTSGKTRNQCKGRGINAVKWIVVGGVVIVSGLALKSNGSGIVCEVAAKCLQMFCRRRKQLQGRNRGHGRI